MQVVSILFVSVKLQDRVVHNSGIMKYLFTGQEWIAIPIMTVVLLHELLNAMTGTGYRAMEMLSGETGIIITQANGMVTIFLNAEMITGLKEEIVNNQITPIMITTG